MSGNKKQTKQKVSYPKNRAIYPSEKEIKEKLIQDVLSNIKIEISTSASMKQDDDSIIDVTNYSDNNNLTNNFQTYFTDVPYWGHQYVYSYSELKGASAEQKTFYFFFKNKFMNGIYLDLEGNTNYAFILLFNLLDEYEKHHDIAKLEQQFKMLGQHYPKTKSYCNSFLIKKMNLLGDSEGVVRIQEENTYNQYWWKLGYKYKDTLNLNKENIKLLNDLQYSSNSFNSIEFCMIEILKLYISTVYKLKNFYIEENTTIEKEFKAVANLCKHSVIGYYSSNESIIINSFYSYIFRLCENAVREYYQHRRLNMEFSYYEENTKNELKGRIVSKVKLIISESIKTTQQPNEDIEIQLYGQNTGRWKHRYKEIKNNYLDNVKFISDIVKLSELNKLNANGVEELFYEATKFIVKRDNETAIKLYFYYLANIISHHKILTDKRLIALIIERNLEEAQKLLKKEYPIVPKLFEFNLFLSEKLFKTNEQLDNFERVFKEFLHYKNMDDAITKIPSIYRKKIKLNNTSILEVQQQHSGTVELLNEYLKDEEDTTKELNKETIQEEITPDKEKIVPLQNTTTIFTPIQWNVLNLFLENNFSIPCSEIEAFSKSNGVFKNQLIESINDLCYEMIDDILIEENDDYYTINSDYYQQILSK